MKGVFEREGVCRRIVGWEEDYLDFEEGDNLGASDLIQPAEWADSRVRYRVKIRVEWERLE